MEIDLQSLNIYHGKFVEFKLNDIRDIVYSDIDFEKELKEKIDINDENHIKVIMNTMRSIKYENKIFKAALLNMQIFYDMNDILSDNCILTYGMFRFYVQSDEDLYAMIRDHHKANDSSKYSNERVQELVSKLWNNIGPLMKNTRRKDVRLV